MTRGLLSVSFALLNRGRRARLFAIAGKRSAYVRPHRRGRLTATLRTPGRFPFVCAARGKPRSVRRGILVVTGPPPPPAPPPAPPTHRVAVSGNHFVEAGTSAPFVARGATYSRFGTSAVPHVTFNVGAYDAARAEDALAEMHVGGYNVVRVFLEIGCADVCLGDPGTHGLRVAYLANLADFLRRAKANAITVMIEGSSVPNGTKYAGMVGTSPDIENINRLYLTAGGVAAEAAFWRDLVAELERQGAPTDDVFAYDIGVETFYDGRYKPFTLSSGAVATGNGKSYDMAVPAQRDLMMDDNLVNFADQVRAAIRSVDPTALVTMSFFAPMGPNLYRVGDFRLVRTKPVFDRSALDFLAVHPYPGVALDLPAYMQNFGLDGSEPKPVVMGEFGAFKWSYKTTGEATPALQQWQADSCRYGFDGWLFWTWDSPSPQPDGGELWNSLDGGAALEHALAPTFRPDPCAPTTNLALGRPVTASSQVVPYNPASMAV